MGTEYLDNFLVNSKLKNIRDAQELIWAKRLEDTRVYYPIPFPDPIGPVKLDAADFLVRGVVQEMVSVEQRLSAMEEHLATGAAEGKAFIPAAQRPNVGSDLVQQAQTKLNLIQERVEKLERSLSEQG